MLSDRLRNLRTQAGLTQRELSRRSGVRQATIQHAEAGVSQPRGQTVRRLAMALRVTVGYLTGQSEDAQPVAYVDLVDCIADLSDDDRALVLLLCRRLCATIRQGTE